MEKEAGFEEQMRRLEAIVRELENIDLPLERSVELYREGKTLSLSCKNLLDQARHSLLLCDGETLTGASGEEDDPDSLQNNLGFQQS